MIDIYKPFFAPDSSELIIKVVGEACNLNCLYCYEKRHPTKSIRQINLHDVQDALDQMPSNNISVGLHGGEPLLLPVKKMESLLILLRKHSKVRDIKLQTNATLLSSEYINLLCKYEVQIGISHDDKSSAEGYRLYYSGKNSEADVEKKLLELSRKGLDIGLIVVVNRLNYHKPQELFDYFCNFLAIKNINLIPCFDHNVTSREKNGVTGKKIELMNANNIGQPDWSISPDQYQSFLEGFYKKWTSCDIQFAVEPFLSVISKLNKKEPNLCTFSTTKCSHVFTLYPGGRVTGCDIYEEDEVGSYNSSDNPYELIADESYSLQDQVKDVCNTCIVRDICSGGCISTRIKYLGTEYYNQYCNHRKNLINMIRRSLQNL